MATVSPMVALLVFFLLITIAVIVSMTMGDKEFQGSRIHIFFSCVAGLAIFITFLFYFSVVSLQQQQHRLSILDETSTLSLGMVTALNQEMQEAAHRIPQFISSLNPLLPCIQGYGDTTDACGAKGCMESYTISSKIFAIWQTATLSSSYIDIEPEALNYYFLQQTSSPYLYEYWRLFRKNYNLNTMQYGNLLFEYGLGVKDKTVAGFSAATEALLADPRYKLVHFT